MTVRPATTADVDEVLRLATVMLTSIGFDARWVATDHDACRRGHGRAVMDALHAWFSAQGVARVELHATHAGEPLDRSLGYHETERPLMQRDAPAP